MKFVWRQFGAMRFLCVSLRIGAFFIADLRQWKKIGVRVMRDGLLSIIVPAYNEELMIDQFYATVWPLMESVGIKSEIVFIDDGSKDATWDKISTLSEQGKHVRGVKFSRNFGKESAIYAGLSAAKDSDCCVVIDCDLQHPPEKVVAMYRLWQEGYEIVEGVKKSRGNENFLHSIGAKLFYESISRATGVDMQRASDFKLLDSKAILALLNCREKNAFFRALSSWIGFKTAVVEFDVREREAGVSKWSMKSLIGYAINNITAFSGLPMQLVTVLGAVTMVAAVVFGVISIVQKCMHIAAEGFTTVILLQLFSSSITMLSLGIVGYYIERIYIEEKARPRFIVAETCGEDRT